MRIIWKKGFEYPVVDDIMINQTILSHENIAIAICGNWVINFTRLLTKDFSKLDKIVVGILPGDGIGPIIMEQAVRVIKALIPDEIASAK